MSKIVNNIYKIHNNPFVFTPLIIEFFKSSESKPKDILLAYLILPLVLYETSRKSLVFARTTSSLITFSKKKENFFGLPERVAQYKDITNQCIQYAIDNEIIQINNELTVEILIDQSNTIQNLKQELIASSKLHKIFKDLDVVAIYKLLGVKEL